MDNIIGLHFTPQGAVTHHGLTFETKADSAKDRQYVTSYLSTWFRRQDEWISADEIGGRLGGGYWNVIDDLVREGVLRRKRTSSGNEYQLTPQGETAIRGNRFAVNPKAVEPPDASYFLNAPERQGEETQVADYVNEAGDGPIGNYGGKRWYLRVPGRMPVMISAIHRGRGGKFVVVTDSNQKLNVDGRAVMFKKSAPSDPALIRTILAALPSSAQYRTFNVADGQQQYTFDLSEPYLQWAQRKNVSHVDQRNQLAYFRPLLDKLKIVAQRVGAQAVIRGFDLIVVKEDEGKSFAPASGVTGRIDHALGAMGTTPERLAQDFTRQDLQAYLDTLQSNTDPEPWEQGWIRKLEQAVRLARKAINPRTLNDIISAVRSDGSLSSYQHDDLLEAAQAIQGNPTQYKVSPRDVDRLVEKLMRQAQRLSNPRDAQYGSYKALPPTARHGSREWQQGADLVIGYLESGNPFPRDIPGWAFEAAESMLDSGMDEDARDEWETRLNKELRARKSAKGWNTGVDPEEQKLLELLNQWLPTLVTISPDKLQQLAKYPNNLAGRNQFSLRLQGMIRQGFIANRGGRLTLTPQGQAQVEGAMDFITDAVRAMAREVLREMKYFTLPEGFEQKRATTSGDYLVYVISTTWNNPEGAAMKVRDVLNRQGFKLRQQYAGVASLIGTDRSGRDVIFHIE